MFGKAFKQRNINYLSVITLAYLLLPFILYCFGWIKLWFALPIVFLVILVFAKMEVINEKELWMKRNQDEIIKIIFAAFLIFACVYYSGCGGFSFQNSDYGTYNQIYQTLVNEKWPVLYWNDATYTFTMAVSHWLPAAGIGKVFGYEAGQYFAVFWNWFGVFLTFLLICEKRKKVNLWPLAVFLGFSGLDIIEQLLSGTNLFQMSNDAYIETTLWPYAFLSNFSMIYTRAYSMIPIVLMVLLMDKCKKRWNVFAIASLGIVTGLYSSLGVFLVAVGMVIFKTKQFDENGKVSGLICSALIYIIGILSWTNNISLLHFMENNAGPFQQNNVLKWIVFIVLEVLIYFALIDQSVEQRKLFMYVIMCLVIIPLVRFNSNSDFCINGAVPFTVLLSLYCIEALDKMKDKKVLNQYRYILLVITLCLGGITGLHELTRSVSQTIYRVNQQQSVLAEERTLEEVMKDISWGTTTEESYYYSYMGKAE